MKEEKLDQIAEDVMSFFPILFGKVLRGHSESTSAKPTGIPYHVLGILRQLGTLSPSEIGRLQHISRPNMTTLIDRLEKDNLVKRYRDPTDRRKILVQITEQGVDKLRESRNLVKLKIKDYLKEYGTGDIDRIFKSLKTIKEIIKKNQKGEHYESDGL